MKASSVRYAAIAAACSAANALHLAHIPATRSVDLAVDGVSPKPTNPPDINLVKRDGQKVLVGPDNTCGYFYGKKGAPYVCPSDYSCVFFTSSAQDPGYAACCSDDNCGYHTACVDSVGFSSKSQCDDGCSVDPVTAKCTESDLPYCNMAQFDNNIRAFYCGSESLTKPELVATTYTGETNGIPFSTSVMGATTTSTITSTEFETETASSTGTSSTSNPAPGGNKGGDSDDDEDKGSKKKAAPVGAIVGGVIGGIGGIALVAIGILLCLRRKKNRPVANNANAAYQSAAPEMQGDVKRPYLDNQTAYAPTASGYSHPSPNGYYPVHQQQATSSMHSSSAYDGHSHHMSMTPDSHYHSAAAVPRQEPIHEIAEPSNQSRHELA